MRRSNPRNTGDDYASDAHSIARSLRTLQRVRATLAARRARGEPFAHAWATVVHDAPDDVQRALRWAESSWRAAYNGEPGAQLDRAGGMLGGFGAEDVDRPVTRC